MLDGIEEHTGLVCMDAFVDAMFLNLLQPFRNQHTFRLPPSVPPSLLMQPADLHGMACLNFRVEKMPDLAGQFTPLVRNDKDYKTFRTPKSRLVFEVLFEGARRHGRRMDISDVWDARSWHVSTDNDERCWMFCAIADLRRHSQINCGRLEVNYHQISYLVEYTYSA
jgi:hypothetical protein